MAALRIFARPCFPQILSNSLASNLPKNTLVDNLKIQARCGSFKSSPKVEDPSLYTDFEVTRNPTEWSYVERLLRPKTIPPAPKTTDKPFASGWFPPSEDAKKLPYFVERTRNYMHPVYIRKTYRGMRKVTNIRKIQGDIWKMESELKSFLEERAAKRIGSQIHEVAGQLNFRGDHVDLVKEWLKLKGF